MAVEKINLSKKGKKYHKQENNSRPKDRENVEVKTRTTTLCEEMNQTSFPRGGATGITPLDFRNATLEAEKEFHEELARAEEDMENTELPFKRKHSVSQMGKKKKQKKISETENREEEKSEETPACDMDFIMKDVAVPKKNSQRSSLFAHEKLKDQTVENGDILVGKITSCEDHGFLIEFESSFYRGFCLFENAKSFLNEKNIEIEDAIGCDIVCRVLQFNSDGRTLSVEIDSKSIEEFMDSENEKKTRFRTTLKSFSILYGTIIESAQVVKVDKQMGISLKLFDQVNGFAILKHISDEKDTIKAMKAIKVGSSLRCRVIGFNHLQEIVYVTLKTSILEQTCMNLSGLHPGMKIEGKILKVQNESGLVVSLGMKMKGFISKHHLSDLSTIKHPEKRFKVGDSISCRVLFVNEEEKKVRLTCKKSLLKDSNPLLVNFEAAQIGQWYTGFIGSVKPFGCIVNFYGNVHGLLPLSHMGDINSQQILDTYRVGQIMKCCVIGVNLSQQKLKLSLHSVETLSSSDSQVVHSDKFNLFQTGDSVQCKLVKIVSEGFQVSISLEGKDIPNQTDAGESSKIISMNAFLSWLQLSDHNAFIEPLKKYYSSRIGEQINATVLCKDNKNRIQLTLKQSLIYAMKNQKYLFCSIENLKVNDVLLGYVKQIVEFGIFVGFPAGYSGLIPFAEVPSTLLSRLKEKIVVGQTIFVKVFSVDASAQKFCLTLKDVPTCDYKFSQACYSQFQEHIECLHQLPGQTKTAPEETSSHVVVGNCVSVKVEKIISPSEISVNFPSSSDFLQKIPSEFSAQLISLSPNNPFSASLAKCSEAVVLDLDMPNRKTVLTFDETVCTSSKPDSKIFQRGIKNLKKFTKKSPNVFLPATIVYASPDYSIVSLESNFGNILGMALYPTLQNPSLYDFFHNSKSLAWKSTLCVGSQVQVQTLHIPANFESCERPILATTFLLDENCLLESSSNKLKNRLQQIEIGKLYTVVVKSVEKTQLNLEVQLGSGSPQKGRVHISQMRDFDDFNVSESNFNPFESFAKDQTINCICLGFRDGKAQEWIPAQSAKSKQMVLEFSMVPSLLKGIRNDFSPLRWDQICLGMKVNGYLTNVAQDKLQVQIAPHIHGRIHALDVCQTREQFNDLRPFFYTGQHVFCYVSKINAEKKFLEFSLRPTNENGAIRIEQGDILPGIIHKLMLPCEMLVRLTTQHFAKINITELSDTYEKLPFDSLDANGEKIFEIGKTVTCCITKITDFNQTTSTSGHSSKTIEASLRNSLVASGIHQECPVKNPRYETVNELEPGMIVSGYIKCIGKSGCFVYLSKNLVGRCKISNLSDKFVKNIERVFPTGALTQCRILSIDRESGMIDLSMKKSDIGVSAAPNDFNYENIECVSEEGLENSKLYKAIVKNITSFGVFLKLTEGNLTGLVRKENLLPGVETKGGEENSKEELMKLYSKGDVVNVVCIRKEDDKKRLFFDIHSKCSESSQNSVHVDTDASEAEGETGSESESESEDAMEVDDDLSVELAAIKKTQSGEEETKGNHQRKSFKVNTQADGVLDHIADLNEVPTLSVSSKFDWNDAEIEESAFQESSSDEASADEMKHSSQSLSKRAKKAAQKKEESRISSVEESLVDQEATPQTAEDFDRILLGSPNSSYYWIQYMAYHISMVDIQKARDTFERSLKTISPGEESERFNVWVASLNLENTYGTPTSLSEILKRCLLVNDPKKVYEKLVGIYEASQKVQDAEETYKLMMKKFKQSKSIYIMYGKFLLEQHREKDFKELMQRALIVLPKWKHISTILKFGQMEFRLGSIEHGRIIFENLLDSYPKRIDILSVYIDMELHSKDPEVIRRLFERAVHMKMSTKKMKFFLKRYLEFEKSMGDHSQIDHVKKIALDYVESIQSR